MACRCRIVSLLVACSLSHCVARALYTWLIKPQYTLPVAMLCCLIVLRHHQSVKRLFAGTEPKVGEKNKKPSDDEESRVV